MAENTSPVDPQIQLADEIKKIIDELNRKCRHAAEMGLYVNLKQQILTTIGDPVEQIFTHVNILKEL